MVSQDYLDPKEKVVLQESQAKLVQLAHLVLKVKMVNLVILELREKWVQKVKSEV